MIASEIVVEKFIDTSTSGTEDSNNSNFLSKKYSLLTSSGASAIKEVDYLSLIMENMNRLSSENIALKNIIKDGFDGDPDFLLQEYSYQEDMIRDLKNMDIDIQRFVSHD